MDLAQRLSRLTPEQRQLLERKLKQQGRHIPQIPISSEYRKNYDRFPLAGEQETWWEQGPIDPFDPTYDVTGPVRLEGNLNINLLEKSIDEVIKRHEILRTIFAIDNGTPSQVILPSLTLQLKRMDFKGLPGNEQEEQMKQLAEDNNLYMFDLTRGPLIKILLIELGTNRYILITVMHHIISDLLSLKIFLKEVAWHYVTFLHGTPPGFDLPGLPFQYVDYACWQQYCSRESPLALETRQKQETFWMDMFKGRVPVLNLPTDYPRPARKSYEGDHEFFLVKESDIQALKEVFLKGNATLYVLVLAIFYVFLAKISGQDDIVVGTLVNTRLNAVLNNMIGVLVKKIPLRCYPQDDKTFSDFLTAVNHRVLELYKNQEYSFKELTKKIIKEPNPGRGPLFDVLLNFIYIDIGEVGMPGLKIQPYTLRTRRVGYDLELVCEGTYKELFFKLSYCTKLFKKETILKFISYFQKIIGTVIQNPAVKISEIKAICT